MSNYTQDGIEEKAGSPGGVSAARLYRRFLGEGARREGALCGIWLAAPEQFSARELLQALQRAMAAPSARLIKEDYRSQVLRVRILGEDALLKRFKLTGADRFTYRFRSSPARRFWAAARTLQSLHIPTPKPLALLECHTLGCPSLSFVLNRFIADAVPARGWIEQHYHRLDASGRLAFSEQLLEHLTVLYRHGLYHRDTKCENILLTRADDADQRQMLWIDLECLAPRSRLRRRDVIRNVVQLNGAIGRRVSADDRRRFLRALAVDHPWIEHPAIERRILQWTRQRLINERARGS